MTTALNPKYTFDTLVVGAANRLAVTAGRTVSENPGSAYNPLFIYGGSGLGKTHLVMAVGHLAKRLQPALNIEYLTLDEYVEAFHAAVAAGQGDAFRRRFQNVDVLLIDDVQFLTNRKEMQSELLRLIEALQEAGRQTVLTSDRPPAEIADLDERLISRLSGGLVVDIGAPDYETRVAILRRKAEERAVRFQPGILEVAAGSDLESVRELMGALNRLIAFQAVNASALNAEAARQLLGAAVAAGQASGAAARASSGASADEFSQFLTDVTVTVGKAVEAWRARVAEAVLRWEGEGYRTARLSALLERDTPVAVDGEIASFTADVERLQALEREVASFDPQAAGQSVFRDPERLAEAEELSERVRQGVAPPPGPSPGFSLDTFAEGPSNGMAVKAVREIVAKPGKRYNPLVLAGPSGRGKSHLLHAAGLELARGRGAVVACLSTQTFIDELIAALDGNRMEWWRARYRRATALLLDDIHLLAEKERTQEEFFNLFNVLLEQERQLVFTAPGPPASLGGLDERLLTRLDGGLVVELGPPDRDVRRGVLARYCAAQHIDADDALLDYLADRVVDSTRELGNMVQRVVSHAAAQALPVTAGLARTVLAGQEGGDRRAAGLRGGGVVVSNAGGVRSREKMVWEWPAPADRMFEERR